MCLSYIFNFFMLDFITEKTTGCNLYHVLDKPSTQETLTYFGQRGTQINHYTQNAYSVIVCIKPTINIFNSDLNGCINTNHKCFAEPSLIKK